MMTTTQVELLIEKRHGNGASRKQIFSLQDEAGMKDVLSSLSRDDYIRRIRVVEHTTIACINLNADEHQQAVDVLKQTVNETKISGVLRYDVFTDSHVGE